MQRFSLTLAVVLVLTLLAGCTAGAPAQPTAKPAATSAPAQSAATSAPVQPAKQPEFVLKEGHTAPATHPYTLGAKRFAELIAERTGGRVRIDVYDNSQLGQEREVVEGLQLGTVDLTVTSTGPLGGFVPEINIVDLPFLFRDREHAYKVLDGPIGQDLLKKFEAQGIKGLAFWENGFRNLTNSKRPINKPEDVKGLKIRTMENKVHLATFRALGADPTPMAWGEVFTSLQQGLLDGQENPIPIIHSYKIYEVQKHLALTGHFYSPSPWLMSKKTWDKLPAEIQEVFAKTALEVATYQRGLIKQQEDEQVNDLKAKGMQVTTPEKKLFQDATMAVYKEFEGQFGKERIQAILDTK